MKTNYYHGGLMKSYTIVFSICVVLLSCTPVFGQLVWQRHPLNPVLPSWAVGSYSLSPTVLVADECGGTYRMWFTTKDFGGPWKIAHAVSLDGLDWSLSIRNSVVMTEAGFPFESNGVSHATVIHDQGGYKMYYTGINAAGRGAIGLATSGRWHHLEQAS
jgi:hypothetical protein